MKYFISTFFGFVIGFLAGLLGVGGGEFRIPVLLYLLKLPLRTVVSANLLIGIFTVISATIFRYSMKLFTMVPLNIIIPMSIGSILGAVTGSKLTEAMKLQILKVLMTLFLLIIGIKFLTKPIITTQSFPYISLTIWQTVIVSFLSGFIIGMISGIFGVAGGEFRIPLLMYVFSLDIKLAGSISLLVSIPTVAVGFLKHYQMNHLGNVNILPLVMMGLSSVCGSYLGVVYAYNLDKKILEFILGAILILATVRMATKP